MAVGIVHVRRARTRRAVGQRPELVHRDLVAVPPHRVHANVEVLLAELHREVNVLASPAALEADLRLPEADAGPAREHPHGVTVRPALDHREAERLGVETLRAIEVGDLEHQLRYAVDCRRVAPSRRF